MSFPSFWQYSEQSNMLILQKGQSGDTDCFGNIPIIEMLC